MRFFKETISERDLENVKVGHRLERGKLKKEIAAKESALASRDSKIETLESKVKDLSEERDYYKNLENDRDAIERQKKVLKTEKEDVEEDKKQ